MPRTATVTLSVPMSRKATTHRLAAIGSTPLSYRIADLIRSFAAKHGLAPIAVEYDVFVGA